MAILWHDDPSFAHTYDLTLAESCERQRDLAFAASLREDEPPRYPVLPLREEYLHVRPDTATIYRVPLAFGRSDYVLACWCGWLSERTQKLDQLQLESCPRCDEKRLSDQRRRELVQWLRG